MNFLEIKEIVIREMKNIIHETEEDALIYNESTVMPDSIMYMQLIVALEEIFCIEFSEQYLDYTLFEEVDDLVTIIEQLITYNRERDES